MARYQKNRREISPASIAGEAGAGAVVAGVTTFEAASFATIQLAGTVTPWAFGSIENPLILFAVPGATNIPPEHFAVWDAGGGTIRAISLAVLDIGGTVFIETTAGYPLQNGDVILYDGKSTTLNAALGRRIPPFAIVLAGLV